MSQNFGSPTGTGGGGGTSETAATIKQKYESNEDTNAFTDANKQKLEGIEPVTVAADIESFRADFLAALDNGQQPNL